jgi:hypothetical protein
MSGETIQKDTTFNLSRAISNIAILILCLLLMGLYAPIGKPIWIDEFLHFALGSYTSIKDAIRVIHKTIVEINHGQTGVYMLADYLLLKMFGASLWALRAPSLLSGALLLIAALSFLRTKGVGTGGQIALLIAYAGQINLMNYMGEARPYMPLAAAVVGVLAYYANSIEQRGNISIKLLGWVSVILGTLMHPYFCLYWYALIIFSYINWLKDNERPIKIKEFITFSNLRLIVAGTFIALAVGSLSWLRERTISFEFDPFQWITQGLWVEFTTFSHFAFIPNARIYIAIALIMPIIYIAGPKRIKSSIEPLLGPAMLMILALSISILLGYLSYVQNYWILHRQWIASEALVPISLAWGCAVIIQKISVKYLWVKKYVWMILIGYIMHSVMPIVLPKLSTQFSVLKTIQAENAERPIQQERSINIPQNNDEWVRLANENVLEGKDVWEVFQRFYGEVR